MPSMKELTGHSFMENLTAKKGEYFGWQFLVNKEGFIAKQQAFK